MEEKLQALNERIIADIDGMPWEDPLIPKQQLREGVKYFIKAYTNDVEKLITEKQNG